MSLELGIIPNFGIFRGLIRSSNTDGLGRTRGADTNGRTRLSNTADADGRMDTRRIDAADKQRILPLQHPHHLLDIALEKFAARRTADGEGETALQWFNAVVNAVTMIKMRCNFYQT